MILDHFLPTLALDIRNIGRRGLAPGPLGRVGAEIVCDDTLVQYAAYLALFLFGGADGIIRFRSFWWGWRLKREIWAMGGFAGFILLSRGMSHLCAWPFWEGIGQMVWDV